MRNRYLSLLLAALLGAAATAALAQTPPPNGPNPVNRPATGGVFNSGLPNSNAILNGAPKANPNPTARLQPVTPVPEPSQWAMMLAGLALVGFIVRRGSKRS